MITSHRATSTPSVLRIIGRNCFKALFAFVLVLGLAVANTAISPLFFGSEAQLFVRLGRESITLDPTANVGQLISVQESRENEINSVFELLRSRMLMERLVDAMGPDQLLENPVAEREIDPNDLMTKLNPLIKYSPRDEAIKTVSKRLSVTAVKRSNVIRMFYEAKSPERAQQILSRLIELARQEHVRVNRTAGSKDFFAEQAKVQGADLRELETKLRDLKDSAGWASLETAKKIESQRLGELTDAQLAAKKGLHVAEARLVSLRKGLEVEPKEVVLGQTVGQPNTAAAKMREQLYDLEIEEQRLMSKFTPDHPQVKTVRAQVVEARKLLGDEVTAPQVTMGPNSNERSLKLDEQAELASIAAGKAELHDLDQQLKQCRDALQKLNQQELEVAELERQIEVATANYRKYMESLEQTRIENELASDRISNLNVLQEPTLSNIPTRPKTMFNYGIGMAGGLAAAVGAIAWGETRRRRRELLVAASTSDDGNGELRSALRRTVSTPR